MAGVGGARGRARIPLALLVSRYFIYVLAGALIAVGVPAGTFAWQMGSGSVLAANYGEAHLEEVEGVLAGQPSFDAGAIPSAYRYARFGADGSLSASDMAEAQLAVARTVASVPADADPHETVGLAPAFYASVELADGGRCVLRYDLMPQWADKGMRDALPNPQDLFVWTALVALVLVVALIALRAGRVIMRKMEPLTSAAEAVGRQDLGTPVGSSDVVEVDDVLRAMEAMRVSLKDSLEARRVAERRNREQVAALAHDLKTPLTVALGNAELLAEDAASGALDADQAASARAIREAALSMDSFVGRIVEASRGQGAGPSFAPVDPLALADRLEDAVGRLVAARGLDLESSRTPAFEDACDAASEEGTLPLWDADALERAVLNLAENACDHADGGHVAFVLSFDAGARSFSIAVRDDGPGFSPEALAHGGERFFRGDASRANSDGKHFGLGLAIASDAALEHGGRLELSNCEDGEGGVSGACATVVLPLLTARVSS